MAFTGFSTILVNKVESTAVMPLGGAVSAGDAVNSKVVGNKKLPATAIAADANVPIKYNTMMERMPVF